MQLTQLNRVRFSGDLEGAESLREDETIAELLPEYAADDRSSSARKELLANAVRIDEDILPELGRTIEDIHRRAGVEEELECYVYADSMINAGVLRGSSRLFVLLSSAAIEKLNSEELEFVIGHEIGHVVYEHYTIPVGEILRSDRSISPKLAIALLAWQRQAEISADRAGLICCGSLEVAASAFFKVLSGLSMPHLKVNPTKFAAQFDHLRDEIFREGAEEMHRMTHPLSPLRMKSMNVFWQSEKARSLLAEAEGGRSNEDCDREISELLAYMDPRARRSEASVDPMLQPFLLWGGLIVAGVDKKIESDELQALAEMVGQHHVDRALAEAGNVTTYHEKLQTALDDRQHPISALDINRVLTCLIAIVRSDGRVEPEEVEALHELAKKLSVAKSYIDGLLQEF